MCVEGGMMIVMGKGAKRIESNGASGMYRMRQSMDGGSGGELGKAR